MKSTQQLIGQRFSRLVVLEQAGKDAKRNILWKCKCDCGNTTTVRGSSLMANATRSCGCLMREKVRLNGIAAGHKNKTHGLSKTPTYSSWVGMMHRCFNPERKQYEDYGGRGIIPCPFLKKSVVGVIKTIGERPDGTQLDRIDNNKGYTCGKCKECKLNGWSTNIQWSTPKTQSRNKRNNRLFTVGGVSLTRVEWAERLGKGVGWVRGHIG